MANHGPFGGALALPCRKLSINNTKRDLNARFDIAHISYDAAHLPGNLWL